MTVWSKWPSRGRILPWVVLSCAGALTVALGILGMGHGGRASTNLDMRWLYLAGMHWRDGISAYTPTLSSPVDPWLREAAQRYDFAYPPQIAPLCLLLAECSLSCARWLMTAVNTVSALILALFGVRLVREADGKGTRSPRDATAWLVGALVFGNPSTAFVIWAGQTTLIATLALMLGWHCARRDRWMIGGALLAVSTIKPQLSFLVLLWLVLERRWRALASAAVSVVVLAAVPIAISGPIGVLTEWSAAAVRYAGGPYNVLGSRMIFGLGSMLAVAGIASSVLLPIAILIVGSLWYYRASLADEDLLPLLVGLSLLFGFSHSYDIAALIPLVPAFWRHVHQRALASLLALGLMLIVTLPNSFLEPYVSPLLLHLRVVALSVALCWLIAMSIRRTAATFDVASEQGITPFRL
jgi:hypothetical protein